MDGTLSNVTEFFTDIALGIFTRLNERTNDNKSDPSEDQSTMAPFTLLIFVGWVSVIGNTLLLLYAITLLISLFRILKFTT